MAGTHAAAQVETVLHSFNENGNGGHGPLAALIFDASGNLYSTTSVGGKYGYGTVFELSPKTGGGWTETVLHSFGSGSDREAPVAGLIFDASGNLYGTTPSGKYDSGTVFELSPKTGGGWTQTVLHHFNTNGKDGYDPRATLIFDGSGNLHGTTYIGGRYGVGTVFELSPKTGGGWTETILHSFNDNGKDGFDPQGGLIFDAYGNLYGTTYRSGKYDYGTVFELSPKTGGRWTETALHAFGENGKDGIFPFASLIFDASGNLYGTTFDAGKDGYGTVFEITP